MRKFIILVDYSVEVISPILSSFSSSKLSVLIMMLRNVRAKFKIKRKKDGDPQEGPAAAYMSFYKLLLRGPVFVLLYRQVCRLETANMDTHSM